MIYSLSIPVYTNSVTYLQPVLLRSTVADDPTIAAQRFPHTTVVNETTATQDPFGLSGGPGSVIAVIPTVYINTASGGAAVEYALDFSSDINFSPNNTIRYTQTVPGGGGSETDPRNGPPIKFGPFDLTTGDAQSRLGSNPGLVYVRVGVRDVRDPNDNAHFIYSTVDPASVTDTSSQKSILPAQLTPGSAASASAVARAKALAKLAQSGSVPRPGALVRVQRPTVAGTSGVARPALTPSVTLHPNAVIRPITPVTPPRDVPTVRPSGPTPGH